MVLRSGSPGSRITSVIRRPFVQWLRLPRKILRNSAEVRPSIGFDRLTTITNGSVAAPVSGAASTRTLSALGQAINITAINRAATRRMRKNIESEGETHLQG